MRFSKCFTIILITFAFRSSNTEKNRRKSDIDREHLKYPNIQKICADRKLCIHDETTKVCTVRKYRRRFQYKEFDNACELFLSNMCEFPGQEFYIITSRDCSRYYEGRRYYKPRRMSGNNTLVSNIDDLDTEMNLTDGDNDSEYYSDENEDIPILREDQTTTDDGTTTEVDETTTVKKFRCPYNITTEDGLSWDSHNCPCSCTDHYVPECMVVNRDPGGKYLKMFTFINHCQSDMYYCKNWELFTNPLDSEDWPIIQKSALSWSFCGASRYVQFARFAEVASSMSHYGWLLGDQRGTYIFGQKEREKFKEQIVRVYSPSS